MIRNVFLVADVEVTRDRKDALVSEFSHEQLHSDQSKDADEESGKHEHIGQHGHGLEKRVYHGL